MQNIKPWGHIDWLLPKIKDTNWKGVFCPSFEDRSVATPYWVKNRLNGGEHFGIRIVDPPSKYTNDIIKTTNRNDSEIMNHLGNKYHPLSEDLLAEASKWNSLACEITKDTDCSILIDISTMPKRVYLFLIKRFLASDNVKDLVVSYACAQKHKEGKLTENASPPSSLPGFARVSESEEPSSAIVSVGYMAFNFAEFIEDHSATTAPRFLFPFPPGSPSFRRNWRRLHDLLPAMEHQAEIKRIHAMDMFAALEWIKSLAPLMKGNIDLVPLGPKPHVLAMGLAHQYLGDSAELIYSQPHLYHPDYSTGIAKGPDGKPDIYAYCLRKDYVDFI